MTHPHFRLKVDLSKFFQDARQYCGVFVDGTKILQVKHLKLHISSLFNIAEPFHLLLNDEYLPPAEDVRLLENNETILVIPGSGINDDTVVHKIESSNYSSSDKEIQICDIKKKVHNKLDMAHNILKNIQPTSINNTRDITFYSVIDEDINNTMFDNIEQDTDPKVADNNFTEDCNETGSVASVAKRKRVRKRKPKNRSSLISPADTNEENIVKKPKIIDSYVIPTAKHIRFGNIESKEDNIAKQIVQETSTSESCTSRASSTKDLSMLLSLGQSSTPVTFVNKKMKDDIKVDVHTASSNGINKNLNEIIEKDNLKDKTCNGESNKKPQSSENLNVEKLSTFSRCSTENLELLEHLPTLVGKPQVNDMIAFKTLKIAEDYTPQMSNFIVTKILDFCEKTENYTLKIIHGKEEVQVPFGKFTLSDDESESKPDTDTFVVNYAQMKTIRKILVC